MKEHKNERHSARDEKKETVKENPVKENEEQKQSDTQKPESNIESAGEGTGPGSGSGEGSGVKVAEEVVAEDLKGKLDSLNDRYIRLVAEFDNYRRRTAREKLDLVVTAAEETIRGILPVLDDFERAIEVLKVAEGDHKAAIEGTELIYSKLYNYLESKGLKRMEPLGHELDTDYHEAVAQYPATDKKSRNKIINVVQNGYLLKGKVIRYAKVVVGI